MDWLASELEGSSCLCVSSTELSPQPCSLNFCILSCPSYFHCQLPFKQEKSQGLKIDECQFLNFLTYHEENLIFYKCLATSRMDLTLTFMETQTYPVVVCSCVFEPNTSTTTKLTFPWHVAHPVASVLPRLKEDGESELSVGNTLRPCPLSLLP